MFAIDVGDFGSGTFFQVDVLFALNLHIIFIYPFFEEIHIKSIH